MHKHITVMSLRLKKQIISSYTDADMLRLSYLFKNPSASIQSLENTHTLEHPHGGCVGGCVASWSMMGFTLTGASCQSIPHIHELNGRITAAVT